jgi:hypothetical protein
MLVSAIGENRGSSSDSRESLYTGFHKCYMKVAIFKGPSVLNSHDFLESFFLDLRVIYFIV